MIKLQGFYNEEILQELLYEEQITQLEYIYHHSQEKIDAFKEYCRTNNMQEDESSATAYLNHLLLSEEEAHTEFLD